MAANDWVGSEGRAEGDVLKISAEERLKIIHNMIESVINDYHKLLPFPHREGEDCLVPALAVKVRRWVEEISGLSPKEETLSKKFHREKVQHDDANSEAR
jgi:hypothetical protein